MWILKIFLLLFGCCFVASSCPKGWTANGPSCYHFSHDKESWANAMTICDILRGQLVEIEGVRENQYIVAQAKQTNQSFWIGLNDMQEEGTWIWVNSKNLITFSNWARSQPDNFGNNENCALLHKGYDYLWNDNPCSKVYHYVCEKTLEDNEVIG